MRITLKAARINKGLTQNEVAIAIKVTKKTVGSWENGKSVPNINKIEMLCELYGRKYDEIQWKV